MKTLDKGNFKGKTVLVRADIDSDFNNGKILLSERIKVAAQTINELKKKKAKVVIIGHQGRLGKDDCTSLKQHARFLNKYTTVKFVTDTIGEEAQEAIKKLENGEAILLENLRFMKEEMEPGVNKITKFFSKYCSVYVNDSFSVSHREQTSIVSFPRIMDSFVGRALERELKALENIELKKCLFILAGAKPEDNIKLLGRNKVLAAGLFGQLCLIATGKNLGAQNEYLKDKLEFIPKLREKLQNVETPIDFAVKVNGKRKELLLDEFPSKYEIFDIGEKTQKQFTNEIIKAKAIYMKGPVGSASDQKFAKGTFAILKAISESKAYSIIGGGHLSDAIAASKIPQNKFGHVSLSGGALLAYLAGEKLPGLVALEIQ